MHEAAASPLAAWESFYVIVGSSAAALTGLQFVVIALVAQIRQQSTSGEIDTFAWDTVTYIATDRPPAPPASGARATSRVDTRSSAGQGE